MVSLSSQRKFMLFMMAAEVRGVNEANGWYDGPTPTVGDMCSLLHSEISEAFDAWREYGFEDQTDTNHRAALHGDKCSKCKRTVWADDDTCPASKPEGYGSELADVLIRLIDQADRHGVDLIAEYERKHTYNRTRSYRHGGKRL